MPLGPGSEVIGGPGALSYDEMKGWLRKARAYLYTGTQPASLHAWPDRGHDDRHAGRLHRAGVDADVPLRPGLFEGRRDRAELGTTTPRSSPTICGAARRHDYAALLGQECGPAPSSCSARTPSRRSGSVPRWRDDAGRRRAADAAGGEGRAGKAGQGLNVLVDRHHSGLYQSLQLLARRLGWTLYTPVGMDWWDEWYWSFGRGTYSDDRLARQYLMARA